MKITILTFTFLTILSTTSLAKRFTNQYCEFEMPNGWNCALEGSEWVCQHTNKQRRKEAIIILAAKLRGLQDSLESYHTYLKDVKTFTLPGGKTQISDHKTTTKSTINNHPWVDSLHLASEVPGFYTRYLATVKEDLGVAVTFSVAKDRYQDYQKIFDRIVATLRVFRDKSATAQKWKPKSGDHTGVGSSEIYDPNAQQYDIGGQKKGRGSSSMSEAGSFLFIIIVAGIAVFFYMRMKKKKKKKGKKKK